MASRTADTERSSLKVKELTDSQMDDVTEGQIERILYEGTEENESAGE